MNEKRWNYILNNYFNGYCTSNHTLVHRRSRRALYLANQEYNRTWYDEKKTLAWQKWYLENYNRGIINARFNNIIPCQKR